MDRRFVGIGVVVAALIAAAILPGIVGKRVTGVAVADPTVPIVGRCLVVSALLQPRFDGGTKGNIAPLVPRASVGPCDSENAARVLATSIGRVEFGYDPAGSPDIDAVDITPLDYSNAQQHICPDPLTLVRPPIPTSYRWESGSVQVELKPLVRLGGALVAAEPGAASGPWLACVAESENNEPVAADLTKPASWDDLAACLDAAGLATSLRLATTLAPPPTAGCAHPHAAQILGGWVSGDPPPTPASIQAACRGFAADITGMPDPTAGGQLDVEWSESMGLCLVAVVDPTKTLTGSLYGIGDAPLPWGS
ncbi:MAG: hypothetical protein ACR2P2_11030 [Nakamurella sp.]